MSFYEILAIAVALAMDAFAVSVSTASSLKKLTFGHYFRFAAAFGGFQFLMPVAGWLLGGSVRGFIEAWDHWIAFTLLALVGLNMIREAVLGGEKEDCGANCKDPTTGFTLLMLAIATSIDALAVGLSFSMIEMSIWMPATVIGVVCATITSAGMYLGQKLGSLSILGDRASIAGGAVLLAIGAKILWEHGVFEGWA